MEGVVEQRSVNCLLDIWKGSKRKNDNFSIFTLFLNPMNYKCAVSEGYYHTVTSESALTLAKFFIFRDHDISCGFAAHTTISHILHTRCGH